MSQTMLGPRTITLTLRMRQLLKKAIVATLRSLSPGTLRKLLTLTITRARFPINIEFV